VGVINFFSVLSFVLSKKIDSIMDVKYFLFVLTVYIYICIYRVTIKEIDTFSVVFKQNY